MTTSPTSAGEFAYDLVVFDWDGTLMDTTGLIARGIQHAARVMGYTPPSLALAQSTIGLDWREALRIAVPECPPSEHLRFNEIYRQWYIPNEKTVFLYEGIRELLTELKVAGVQIAVATGKSRLGLNRVLAATGLETVFDSTKTADETASKPQPDMLEWIGIETGVAPERTVMVGDSVFDIVMANRYGCDAIAMLYGAGDAQTLRQHRVRYFCHDVAQLRQALYAEKRT